MNYSMNSGRLKHKVEIWKYIKVENELGGESTRLSRIKTVYAEVRPMRGKEYLEYYQNDNSLEYKITMRYHQELTPDCVLIFRDRQFEIQSVINIEEAGGLLEVMCTEKLKVDKAVIE